jgi:hypothetical protein
VVFQTGELNRTFFSDSGSTNVFRHSWLAGLICSTAAALGQQAHVSTDFVTNVMPSAVDSNSPAYWRDGRLHLINSTGVPMITSGDDQLLMYLGHPREVAVDSRDHLPMWIEAAWQDEDGTLYSWYHHEPGGVCPGSSLTTPQIGALVSTDGGESFIDLGIVLSSGDDADCSAQNGFFAGGHGDFSVILDRDRGFFYFLFGNYGGEPASQGVAVARMAFDDRASPKDAVWKYYEGAWAEPGIEGRLTPVFKAKAPWSRPDADSFWGPSVHWNTHLESYVVLLNRACCAPMWPQEGIYVTFNRDLGDPSAWTEPQRILQAKDIGFAPAYYPQVLGLEAGETDTLAGRVARLYIKGLSRWKITFDP